MRRETDQNLNKLHQMDSKNVKRKNKNVFAGNDQKFRKRTKIKDTHPSRKAIRQ